MSFKEVLNNVKIMFRKMLLPLGWLWMDYSQVLSAKKIVKLFFFLWWFYVIDRQIFVIIGVDALVVILKFFVFYFFIYVDLTNIILTLPRPHYILYFWVLDLSIR